MMLNSMPMLVLILFLIPPFPRHRHCRSQSYWTQRDGCRLHRNWGTASKPPRSLFVQNYWRLSVEIQFLRQGHAVLLHQKELVLLASHGRDLVGFIRKTPLNFSLFVFPWWCCSHSCQHASSRSSFEWLLQSQHFHSLSCQFARIANRLTIAIFILLCMRKGRIFWIFG